MCQWAINRKDSFLDAAIVYLSHETNGTACDKREKHIQCEFSYSGGRDSTAFKNITLTVTINRMFYRNTIFQWYIASGKYQMSLCENKLVCKFYSSFFLASSFSTPE